MESPQAKDDQHAKFELQDRREATKLLLHNDGVPLTRLLVALKHVEFEMIEHDNLKEHIQSVEQR